MLVAPATTAKKGIRLLRATSLLRTRRTSVPPPVTGAAGADIAPLAVRRHGWTAQFCTTPPPDDDWQTIADALAADCRFAGAAWMRAWAQCLLPRRGWQAPLVFWTVRDDRGALRAMLPLATQRRFGVAVAALGGLYWPFRSPLIPDDGARECAAALASALTASATPLAVRLGPVPADRAGTTALIAALEERGWRIGGSLLGHTFAVLLPGTWSAFERTAAGSVAKKAVYYERRMARHGTLDVRLCEGASGAAARALRDIGEIERRSWQHRAAGEPRFAGERMQSFWRSVLADPRAASAVRAWVMYFDGVPVSFCFCIDSGDTRHVIANHYAEEVRAYSTGSILYRHVFRDASKTAGLRRIDIGLGDSGYKRRWGASASLALQDWIAFRPGLRGRLMRSAYALR